MHPLWSFRAPARTGRAFGAARREVPSLLPPPPPRTRSPANASGSRPRASLADPGASRAAGGRERIQPPDRIRTSPVLPSSALPGSRAPTCTHLSLDAPDPTFRDAPGRGAYPGAVHRLGGFLLLISLPALGATGCRGGPGHPVRTSLGARPSGATGSRVGVLEEPAAPGAATLPLALFRGLDGVLARLAVLRELPVPDPRRPTVQRVPEVEAAVRTRYAAGGFGGAVRSVVAVAAVGRVPLAPRAMADLMRDPEVERQVLAAHVFRRLGTVYALPGAQRERFRVELLGMGEGPLRYDLRFTVVAERREGADGRIWLRYDPDPEPAPEHVTLYRGGCLIEPDGAGARVTELVILGTDLRLLPPFQSALETLAADTLRNRVLNLWVRAWK